MKNTRFLIILSLALTNHLAFGQSYKTAAGIRLDKGVNFTVQQHIVDNWTVEGILHTPLRSEDIGVTLLAERHQKILFRGINLYAGGGAHYYWKSTANRVDTDPVVKNVFGITGIGGLEMSLGRLNFAFDWKPELHLAGDEIHPFEWSGASVSVRYILAKRERKKISDWGVWDKFGKKKK